MAVVAGRARDGVPSISVEVQPEGATEGRKRPLGGIGLGRLERDVVNLARRGAPAFSGAVALPDDGRLARLHRDPDLGGVDGQEIAAVLPGKHAAGFQALPVPAVEAEDAVGLRDRVPALDIAELPPVRFSGAHIAVVERPAQGLHLFG